MNPNAERLYLQMVDAINKHIAGQIGMALPLVASIRPTSVPPLWQIQEAATRTFYASRDAQP